MTSPTKPSAIREDFDRDYCAWVKQHQNCSEWEAAIWAGRWMAEYLAPIFEEPDMIRQLAKELR